MSDVISFYVYLALIGIGISIMVVAFLVSAWDSKVARRKAKLKALGMPEVIE